MLQDIDVVMSMHNLRTYSDNYSHKKVVNDNTVVETHL